MQQEIIKVLKKNKKPMRRTDIAKALNVNPIKISMALKQLIRYNEVKYYELDHWKALDIYGSKRRMRLYYVEE